jgi:hypothetical protein
MGIFFNKTIETNCQVANRQVANCKVTNRQVANYQVTNAKEIIPRAIACRSAI